MKKRLLVLTAALFAAAMFFSSCKQPDAVDITPPAEVTDLKVKSEEGFITLTWVDPADEDFYGAKIYNGSVGVVIEKGKQKYEVSGLTDGTEYQFKVTSLDKNLNESEGVISAPVTFKEKVIKKTEIKVIEKIIEKDGKEIIEKQVEKIIEKDGKEIIEVEKLVPTAEVPEDGTYTIYHIKQAVNGELFKSNYYVDLDDLETKTVEKGAKLEDIEKSISNFTATTFAVHGNEIYIFYDRNIITYTFNSGTEGAFKDSTTTKTVSGLYGANVTYPEMPVSETKYLSGWKVAESDFTRTTFGDTDLTITAVWADKAVAVDYSTAAVGDIVLTDGSICKAEDYDSATMKAAAVIVRAKTEDLPALGVGIKHNRNGLRWCESDADGYSTNVEELITDYSSTYDSENNKYINTFSGYTDGSDSWEKLTAASPDALTNPEKYPAWNYAVNYANNNSLGAMAEGWYLPTVAELYTIFENITTIDNSLSKAGGSRFNGSWYWSCTQYPSYDNYARILNFGNGNVGYNNKNNYYYYVCSVRAFN